MVKPNPVEGENTTTYTPYSSEISKADWNTAGKKELPSSIKIALKMKRGAYLKISHPDVLCDIRYCGLGNALSKRKKLGRWRIKHTKHGEAYVYREV